MGAGKSTVAAILADRLGWRSIDLDTVLANSANKSIAEIFSHHGEVHFRKLETKHLYEHMTDAATPFVLAVGGGAVESAANLDLLASASDTRTFYLEAPLEVLLQRCCLQEQDITAPRRPLLTEAEALFERRAALYAAVGTPIATFGFSAEEVAQHILSLLQMEGSLDTEP
jgi:shikimate kinase